jgi:peptidyl-Asp metalloendopeptidase
MSNSSISRARCTIFLSLALSVATLGACVTDPDPDPLAPTVGAFGGLSAQELAAAERDYRGPAPLAMAAVHSRFRRFDAGPLHAQLTQRPSDTVILAPFAGVRLRFDTTRLEDLGGDGYLWEAEVESDVYGQSSLTFNEHGMFGTVQVGQRIYEFMPVKTGVVLVTQYNQASFPLESMPREPAVDGPELEPPADGPAVDDVPDVPDDALRVMLVLPRPYSYLCGRFPSLLPIDFRRLVAATYRSNLNRVFNAIRPTGVSADVVVHCVDYEPIGGDLNGDLDWVQTDADIADARDTQAADLVSLIVPDASYCGRAYLNFPVTPQAERTGFSVVRGSCALGNYTFAHELGHNLGMRHDRITDGAAESPDCNYGYFFAYQLRLAFLRLTRQARTVMAYPGPCDSCERHGLYSNPTSLSFGLFRVDPMGAACDEPATDGTYDRADNRQQLIDAAPIVSRFR